MRFVPRGDEGKSDPEEETKDGERSNRALIALACFDTGNATVPASLMMKQ